MLAYCEDGNDKAANTILNLYQQNGTRQEMLEQLIYLKTNFDVSSFRCDEARMLMFQNYESMTSNPIELEFLLKPSHF